MNNKIIDEYKIDNVKLIVKNKVQEKIIKKQKLKIESLVNNIRLSKNNGKNNSFGITNLEYETLEKIRNDLYNKTLREETDKGKEDDSYNKYIEYRNEKRKNNERLLEKN